jgi:tripartite-type tricarboxylate transporter receptor subunit TctC
MNILKTFALSAAVILGAMSALHANEDVASFYKGKSIRLIVGGAAGGGYDAYARLLARYMSKYIP